MTDEILATIIIGVILGVVFVCSCWEGFKELVPYLLKVGAIIGIITFLVHSVASSALEAGLIAAAVMAIIMQVGSKG